MRSVSVILPLAFLAQMHCKELEEQNLMNKLLDIYAERLTERVFQEWSPNEAQLDRTTLAKPGSVATLAKPGGVASLGKALPSRSAIMQPKPWNIYALPNIYRPPRPVVFLPFASTQEAEKTSETDSGVTAAETAPPAVQAPVDEMDDSGWNDPRDEDDVDPVEDAAGRKWAEEQAREDIEQMMASSSARKKENFIKWHGGGGVPTGRVSVAKKQEIKEKEESVAAQAAKSEDLVESLKGKTFTTSLAFKMNKKGKIVTEVDQDDIVSAIKDSAGVTIGRKEVVIDKPFKKEGEYDVTLKLKGGVTAEIKVKVEADKSSEGN